MNDEIRLQDSLRASTFEELFDSYQPMLNDRELFNQRLERKLALIDEVRQVQAAQIHCYHMAASISIRCFSLNKTAVSFPPCSPR